MKRNVLLLLLFLSFFMVGYSKPVKRASVNLEDGQKTNLSLFLSKSSQDALNPNISNPIYSPLSLYMTLSLMAETLDLEAKEEILDYLNVESINALRENNKKILEDFSDNSLGKEFKVNNFLFKDTDKTFNQRIIDVFVQNYEINNHTFDLQNEGPRLISEKINIVTNEFLNVSEDAINEYIKPSTVSKLMNVLYFKDNWAQRFDSKEIEKKPFYLDYSLSKEVDTLIGERRGLYYENDTSQAGVLNFEKGSKVYFVLPRENKSIEDCIKDNVITNLINHNIDLKYYNVEYNIPKFDVSYKYDLTSLLKQNGLDKTYSLRDDSPFYDDLYGYDETIQYSRIMLDEEGVKAATATTSFG